MNNDKLENLLNLSLDATPEERAKSLELSVGFSPLLKTWELIVKYNGNLKKLEEKYEGVRIVELSNEYGVMRVPQVYINEISMEPEIEYIEKPKRLYFAVNQGVRTSCITSLYTGNFGLSGKGVIVACIDSGIDYLHPDFRKSNGETRILYLWDQTLDPANKPAELEGISWNPPAPFFNGVEFTESMINQAIAQGSVEGARRICPSIDLSGHGTHVAGIAAGNGRASDGKNRGVAFESDLIIVKLGTPLAQSFPRTTELIEAIDYVISKGKELQKPVAINLSFGNNYGSHDGTSLLETYLSDISNYWKNTIVVGSGNEGNARGHAKGVLKKDPEEVEFSVGNFEPTVNIQIWKSYADTFGISVIHPNGSTIGNIRNVQGTQRFSILNTEILVYFGEPRPYSPYQEIYLDFIPKDDFIDPGVWVIRLLPEEIVTGIYNMWMPASPALNLGTGFLKPNEETTLTTPSTAAKVITVGAYDSYYQQYASFSGRGYTRVTNQVKPDLCAPGVDITSSAPGGGYTTKTGTSMAAPFVTGGSALMMEWGIVRGNDEFLYGEKVKAYFIKGARKLPGFEEYPNPQLGWGVLCVRDSFPV